MKGRFHAHHRAAIVMVLSVLLGSALGVIGMLLYPGGTWFDRHAKGYDFWRTFLCDPMHQVALNGTPNETGAWLTQAGLMILMLGLLPLWMTIPVLFPSRSGLGRVVRGGGCIATFAMLPVALTPSDRFGTWHQIAVTVAGPLGIGAMLGILLGLYSVRHSFRGLVALTMLLIVLCAADVLLYLRLAWFGVPLTPTLPIVQKLALLAALLWILSVARAIAVAAPRGSPGLD